VGHVAVTVGPPMKDFKAPSKASAADGGPTSPKKLQKQEKAPQEMDAQAGEAFDRFIRIYERGSFSISAMAFQDGENLDLERLRFCCIHVAAPDGRFVPFCAWNLTARNGRALHRKR